MSPESQETGSPVGSYVTASRCAWMADPSQNAEGRTWMGGAGGLGGGARMFFGIYLCGGLNHVPKMPAPSSHSLRTHSLTWRKVRRFRDRS